MAASARNDAPSASSRRAAKAQREPSSSIACSPAVCSSVDVVVVGLGAAGGTIAAALAERGLQVVGLEAGPELVRPADFRDDVEIAGRGKIPVHRPAEELSAGLFGAPTQSLTGSAQMFQQLTEDQTMVRTQRRPPAIWIWAGIASVLAIIIATMFWAFSLQQVNELPESSREVPSLTGLTFDDAQTQLQELDLAATEAKEASDSVPDGQVIRTDPIAGTIVQPGAVVKVVTSTGKDPVAIPDVVNQTLDEAVAALEAAGLQKGSVTTENSPTIAGNIVIRTDPAGSDPNNSSTFGSEGTVVNLVVSSGLVTLPDLVGQSLAAATDLLGTSALQLTAVPMPDSGCAQVPGSPVTAQSVGPGDVPQRSEVQLTYCAG